ncbi:MAG: DEAD/DEAH box helicase, partial [Myxococcota bacterium]
PAQTTRLPDDTRYVALHESLAAKLSALSAVTDADAHEPSLRLSAVAAGLVSSWAPDLKQLKLDKESRGRLKRAKEAATLQPELPCTLQAVLRSYQREGFEWMTRLAHWGAGACLADDMGLGKTVQTLALLLKRAEDGPALVVAPTSVCGGWLEQAQRFAPTLQTEILTAAPDTHAWGEYTVVVVSYTMMVNHIDTLAEIPFSTVVLDEAQAIKNASTQRAKAARRLKGAFRIATTGTPIENHLGEVWSLMTFLNPGLLGTAKAFDRRFAKSSADAPQLDALRNLLKPFILRRQKRNVLKELPERTEIIIEIEPSEEEIAFSEALRRRAVDRFNKNGRSAKKSAVSLLAELTRLRQAACHPALVDENIGLSSSKLTHLTDLAKELVQGGHRMLVFSQFVSFLSHVRQAFEQNDISYQYLDGSTPRRERERSVREFQAGRGDAFIISLKAGGTGLNLTGADYVIHLDPWWNPAIDDQASSRAHRIGQKRPVTVYKLITKGSVEERVYALHGEKRNLAEKLLSGTSSAQIPDAETLLALLQETR